MPGRRRALLLAASLGALVIAVTLVTCRVRALRGLTEHALLHQGRERTFFVHLPPGHSKDRPVPMVIALHGGGGSAWLVNKSTNYSLTREADAHGWVLLVPQGVAKGWNDGRPILDRGGRERAGVDDVGFIAALIDHAKVQWGIDSERVFVTGISNGGAMSFRLALSLSARIRAAAPVTMSLPAAQRAIVPGRVVSLLMVNGTEDPLVPFAGGQIRVLGKDRGEVLSTDDTLELWAKHAGCSGRAPDVHLGDLDPEDGTRVTLEERRGCEHGTRVALYRVEGGGHTWPGGTQYLPARLVGRVSRDFDASKAIFDFFASHAGAPSK
jgi:polyhydroxybutyrate depolymerase